ncbi:MAG: multifunctional CCA addition/repair protein [Lautropia sp.]|nr:MAG: multifunctional CCA addition/repair protein [Pseudomonadota bacterium]MBC6959950.1 multifunctional CCA addition/repair protein [Lautropia sp.]MCL4700725.1 multifunctional CCA addition/repair protein [Burkholderiaceae bacterium]MCZ2414780.1 multifunctional CCA addition/repair protein [Burkholderiales bacterium]MDL1908400.1 multifunctional CCA addition/repair protein [Betaproteobacteria bacterium PRO1]
MKIYCVGGAVRDELLGLPVKDHDWVVVGATPEMLIERGFQPVGRDFPVFLHPQTHEEYALARTERKTAPGYRGFAVHYAPDVTLEDDLLRRDLTINAMARDADGALIDPHGGLADLRAGILRHVGPAFAEDPVRILRVARFAARFDRFAVAPQTMTLMRRMVGHGEVDALVPERVWQELSRGLMERHPSRMFAVLRDCGALARIVPEVDRLWGVPQPPEHHPEIDTGVHVMMAIDHAAATGARLAVRFATLLHDVGKGTTPREQWPHHPGHEKRSAPLVDAVCERLRVPVECRDLALLVAREHELMHRALELRAGTLTRLLERLDVLRRPQRLDDLIAACECDWRGRLGFGERAWPQAERLRLAAQAMRAVDAGAIAAAHAGSTAGLREAIHAARVAAVAAAIAAARRGSGRGR